MGYGSKQWQDWVLDEEDSLPLIEHAYKQGINTWDTVNSKTARFSRSPNKLLTVTDRRTSTPTANPKKSLEKP